ncbi:MAG: hypothetical protein JW729_08925 [Bacteroidales bacterium]|nr:hypothetical protein [Bacteroidales bacterium]
MVSLEQRKNAFEKLGQYLKILVNKLDDTEDSEQELASLFLDFQNDFLTVHRQLRNIIQNATNTNPWFLKQNVRLAISAISESLLKENLDRWLEKYQNELAIQNEPKQIGIVMAGNIPLVGFHDYLSVLMSGNKVIAKVSREDKIFLPMLHQVISFFEPELADYAVFTQDRIRNFSAIIATGSDNTARYFDYYFGKYPHIIRKNRNGVAILSGQETHAQLEALAADVFTYFGLGCRNVSKLFVPKEYDFKNLMIAFEKYNDLLNHSKYFNNYEYNKAIFLVNKSRHLDNGFVLLKEDSSIASPIAVLFFEFYENKDQLAFDLLTKKEKIQCILSNENLKNMETISFGKAQSPELWDYADGIDTLSFLLALK